MGFNNFVNVRDRSFEHRKVIAATKSEIYRHKYFEAATQRCWRHGGVITGDDALRLQRSYATQRRGWAEANAARQFSVCHASIRSQVLENLMI